VTIVAGAIAGWFASRRLLRPLDRMSHVAVDISGGRFDRRLDDEGDADLAPLVESFNEMVDGLQERIEREARFASEVSHELRTPLTAMSTAVEVVRRRSDELPERLRPAIDVLASQVVYFERLVLDLLEISRLDAGVERSSPEHVDLREFVERLTEMLSAPPPAVEGQGPWDLHTDKRRLERVLANLIENADRHGGGVTAVRLARTNGAFRVMVEDHGPGIPEEDREKVFHRFWRGVASRQSSSKGTGLGLTLVSQHLRMLDGQVSIEPNPPAGARFVVELPADTNGVAP
jgi:signal transduction histidine kinase